MLCFHDIFVILTEFCILHKVWYEFLSSPQCDMYICRNLLPSFSNMNGYHNQCIQLTHIVFRIFRQIFIWATFGNFKVHPSSGSTTADDKKTVPLSCNTSDACWKASGLSLRKKGKTGLWHLRFLIGNTVH